MCRVLIYLGKQDICIYDLLYASDNSLSHQSYAPQLMDRMHNLAGFGFCAWSPESFDNSTPFYYRTIDLPFFDKNLYRLSKKISSNCFLAHIRGVEYSINEVINEENSHPFKYDLTELAFAHNGFLPQFYRIKLLLTNYIKPEIYCQINGTTDSEFIYAIFLSQLINYRGEITKEEVSSSLIKTLVILKKVMFENKIHEPAPLNLFITNGKFILVTRFVLNFGQISNISESAFIRYYTLWATFGEKYGLHQGQYKMYGNNKRHSILFASEPLTKNKTTWIELPEYSITTAWSVNDEIHFRSQEICI